MDRKALRLLIRSFDSDLNADDRRYLQQALEQSAELEVERKILEEIRASAARSRVASFGPDFSGRILQAIQSESSTTPPMVFPSLEAIFRPVVLVSAAVIVALASISFFPLKNSHGKGIDKVIAIVEDANTLFVEEQLCLRK